MSALRRGRSGAAAQGASFDEQLKVLLIGDSGVGKTCILLRYVDDKYTDAYITTIGIDFKTKHIQIEDGRRVKMQLWDTAGQERFQTMTRSYFTSADAVALVYDVTDRESYENVTRWLRNLRSQEPRAATVLVANKMDTPLESRQVTEGEGAALAAEHGMGFRTCSAKTGAGVAEVVAELAEVGVRKLDADDRARGLSQGGVKPSEGSAGAVDLASGSQSGGGGGGGGGGKGCCK